MSRKLTPEEIKKLELAKLRRALQQQLDECLDADDLDSRPRGDQIKFLQDADSDTIWIVAANRSGKCLVEGTKVATPKGIIPIEKLKVGDTVYDEYGKEIKVKDVFNQGIKEVVDLTHRGVVQASCTLDHIWEVETGRGQRICKKVKDFSKSDAIIRNDLVLPLGQVDVESYAIGALLGDGCSRERSTFLKISSATEEIPKAISPTAFKSCADNHTWTLDGIKDVPFYTEWCKGRYAHEKIIDLDVVRTWNRRSVLKLLAGLLDTDGSISYSAKYNLIDITITMQARSCIEFVQWAILTLYQYNVNILVDNRSKYKNGPCYFIRCRNSHITKRMAKELAPYMNCPHKRYKEEWEVANTTRFNPKKMTVKITNPRMAQCFDIHVDSSTNLYCLANGLVTHNTATWVRAVIWWLTGKHPYVKPPKSWGDKFNILVVGRTLEILGTEIWEKKMKPLLPPGSFTPTRSGPTISSVEYHDTGNKLIFMSHHDARNAREKVQGFTAPVVVIDEMPDDAGLVSELIMRTATIVGAKFIGAFTPLVENDQIRKVVDASGTRYNFKPEDNPRLMERFGTIEEYSTWLRAQCATDAEYNARRFGEWYYRSGRVIAAYDASRHMRPMFEGYHPRLTRHVAIVDPAAVGLVGVTLWAEGPGVWQCAYSAELSGDAAFNLVKDLETIYKDYNVVERRCDCNPAGFYKEALRQGINYIPIADKMDRKWETIEKANAAFAQDTILLSPESQSLADQCLQAKVSETNTNKIIASSSWHLIDCLRYFVDNMPKAVAVPRVFKSISHARKQTYMEERAARQKKQQQQMRIIQKRNERRWSRR